MCPRYTFSKFQRALLLARSTAKDCLHYTCLPLKQEKHFSFLCVFEIKFLAVGLLAADDFFVVVHNCLSCLIPFELKVPSSALTAKMSMHEIVLKLFLSYI